MDDKFLHDQRRDPDPAFARDLRDRLHRIEEAEELGRRRFDWRPVFATAAAAAFVIAAFTVPAVRATAQAALDLFRVQEFTIVQVDPARIEKISHSNVDLSALGGGHVEMLQEPLPPRMFATLDEASALVGAPLERPYTLPRGLEPDSVFVKNESRMRITVDTKPVRALLELMEVRDVTLPDGLDGEKLTVHLPTMVAQRFHKGERMHAMFLQGSSPLVELPPGLQMEQVGEVGLRLLGMSPSEARRLSRSIDWRTTLVVPVVAGAAEYQQVRVQGQPGLFVRRAEGAKDPKGEAAQDAAAVVWTKDGRVHALMSDRLDRMDLLTMAESVR